MRQRKDKLTQLSRLPFLLRQEVKGSSDLQLQGQDGGRGKLSLRVPLGLALNFLLLGAGRGLPCLGLGARRSKAQCRTPTQL